MTDPENEAFPADLLERQAEPFAIRMAQGFDGSIWTRLTREQREVWRYCARRALATLNEPLPPAQEFQAILAKAMGLPEPEFVPEPDLDRNGNPIPFNKGRFARKAA